MLTLCRTPFCGRITARDRVTRNPTRRYLRSRTRLQNGGRCLLSSQPRLTWQGYEQIGEVGGALDKRTNLIYTSLNSEAQQACVRRLFLELGEGETATRRRVTKGSFNAVADSPEQLEKLLEGECFIRKKQLAMQPRSAL